MIAVYFLVKLLYLLNSIGQLFLLNIFVGDNYIVYGFDVAYKVIQGQEISDSSRFPRTTLCSFYIRQFGGNTHRHTVQCVLPINLFNEKIFIFLWFWLVFVSVFTLLSIGCWLWDITSNTRVSFVKRYIKMMPQYDYNRTIDRRAIRAFANNYMKQDGVFILRLIGRNVNEVILCEIIHELYLKFKTRYYKPKQGPMEGDEFADGQP